MRKRALSLFFPIVALILELLPYGAVCLFGNPEGEPQRKTFSYFDFIPFGYANVTPFFTAVTTCLVLVLLGIFLLSGSLRIATLAKVFLCIAVAFSLCPLLFGIHHYSFVGALITLSLIAGLGVLHFGAAR